MADQATRHANLSLSRNAYVFTDFHIVKELLMSTYLTNSIQSYLARRLTLSFNSRLALENRIELVEPRRIELLTSCVQGRRSPS